MIESMVMPMLAEDAGQDAAGVEVVRAMLIVLGIVIIAAMLVITAQGKIARRQSDRPTAREQIELAKAGGGRAGGRMTTDRSISGSAHPARSGGRVSAADVDEARQLAALLDNKAERLEQLLTEAEARIAHLERLMPVDDEPGASTTNEVASPHDRPTSLQSTPTSDNPTDPLTRSVYELADEGHGSVEIAQRLDEQVGKIDLILALRR